MVIIFDKLLQLKLLIIMKKKWPFQFYIILVGEFKPVLIKVCAARGKITISLPLAILDGRKAATISVLPHQAVITLYRILM